MLVLDKDNFQAEVLEAEGCVLVDYWNESCEPCKALMPDIEALEESYGDKVKFAKLNTNGARRLAISQKVMGLPTIILYKNGEKVAEATKEEANKATIEKMIQEHAE